jgi:hypothetical protein
MTAKRNKSNLTEEKMIVAFLTKQPPESWLSQAKTPDQFYQWVKTKQDTWLLANALRARFTGENNPLEPYLQSGFIDNRLYESIWLRVDWLEQLWGLTQLVFSDVKAEVEEAGIEFPFDSALSLFKQLLKETVNERLRDCLKSYYEFSPQKQKKYLKSLKSALVGGATPIQMRNAQSKLRVLPPKSLHWYGVVIGVCHQNATNRRPSLQAKFNATRTAFFCYFDFLMAKSGKAPSFAWAGGVKIPAKVGGIYARDA